MEWWQDLERVDAMRKWTVLGWKVVYWLNRRCQVVKKGTVRCGEFVDEEEDPIWEHGIFWWSLDKRVKVYLIPRSLVVSKG